MPSGILGVIYTQSNSGFMENPYFSIPKTNTLQGGDTKNSMEGSMGSSMEGSLEDSMEGSLEGSMEGLLEGLINRADAAYRSSMSYSAGRKKTPTYLESPYQLRRALHGDRDDALAVPAYGTCA